MPPPTTVVKEGQVDDDVGSGAVANTPGVTGDDSPPIAAVINPIATNALPLTPTPAQMQITPPTGVGGHVGDFVGPGVEASIQEFKDGETQDSTEMQKIPTTVQMPPPPTVAKGGQVDDVVGSDIVANIQEAKVDDSTAIAAVIKPIATDALPLTPTPAHLQITPPPGVGG